MFKKDGFQDEQIPVPTRVAGSGAAGFAGNILLGGVIGMAADASTGATLEHFPNPVLAVMRPSEPPRGARGLVKRRSAPTS